MLLFYCRNNSTDNEIVLVIFHIISNKNNSLTIFVELALGVFLIPKGWNNYSKVVRF